MRQTRYLILLTLAGAASGAAQVPVTAADSSRPVADSARRAIADVPRAPAVTPGADQARGVDAELRVALFDLLAGRELPALSRLQHLEASPVALTGAASGGALRGRQDVLFLLAQSYYRLGIDAGFRRIAEVLLREPSAARYAPVLRAQLLVDAYRGGDYARALELSRRIEGGDASGLTALVAGLAAYQSGNFAAARTALARARQTGGAYAGYAAYMDALTTLRADTGQTGPALAALKTLAGTVTGELVDQVRLTAAQVAYESSDYAEAASLAQSVSAESGLASQALLTRAWSLYKADQVEAAGSAFSDFATRFPLLPQRDESRLMAAQALLQLGRSAEAERSFKLVADSSAVEMSALQGAATASMEGAARSLVADRSVGLLMVADPSAGKTVTLDDAAAYDASVLASVVSDTARPRIASTPPAVVSVMDVTRRNLNARPVETDSLRGPLGGAFPMRVLFMPASATAHPQAIAVQSRALFDADGAVALARFRLEELLEAQAREAALLEALQTTISGESAAVESLAAQIQAARDSLAALDQMMSAAEARIRSLFSEQIAGTRELAEANVRAIDSLRTGFAGRLGPTELEVLDNEARTAATYLRIAQLADSGSTAAIARHPTFAMRDSARAHGERAGALLAELQASRANAQRAIAAAMSRLQQGQGPDAQTMRSALATAETQRATIEAQLVTTVRSELLARAGEMVEELQRDAEAAQFGTASASFFQAIDAGRSPGTTSPGTTPGSRNTEPAAAPATPPTQKK